MNDRTTALFLRITLDGKDTYYRLSKIAEGWKLVKTDGTEYEVYTTGPKPRCSCPNATYRTNHDCKHKRALKAHGLIE